MTEDLKARLENVEAQAVDLATAALTKAVAPGGLSSIARARALADVARVALANAKAARDLRSKGDA